MSLHPFRDLALLQEDVAQIGPRRCESRAEAARGAEGLLRELNFLRAQRSVAAHIMTVCIACVQCQCSISMA